MWICVDLERLAVVYKHEDQCAVIDIANLEMPEAAMVVMCADDPDSYARFTDFELKALYANVAGTSFVGYNRKFLITDLIRFVRQIAPTKIEGRPKVDEDFVPPRIMAVEDPEPNKELKKYFVPPQQSKVHKRVTYSTLPQIPAPHIPVQRERAPRDPSAPVAVPQSGSKTGRVWEIADAYYKQVAEEKEKFGRTWDMKNFAKDVKALCIAEGVNPSTASVQYSKWKASKGL